jgi:hypothetical protein
LGDALTIGALFPFHPGVLAPEFNCGDLGGDTSTVPIQLKVPSTMPSNEQRRLGARGWPKAPFASLSHGETVSPDLDDWDYNYKLEGGRLISSNLYSGHSNLVTPLLSTSPSSLGGQQRPPAAPQMSLQVQYSNPQSTPLAAVDPQDEVTKWHDPDPVFQVVDCKDDTEFLSSLHRVNPVVVPKVGRNASGTWSSHNDARLKSWRQEIFQTAPELTPTMPKVRRKKETRKLATIEQVLNEMIMYPCDNPGDGSSTATSIAAESEMKKEMAMDSCVNSDADGVKICSSDGGIVLEFPRQTLALGGYFVKLMNREGFDGEIVLEEPKSAVEMLGAWMSRDLDFEITIGKYSIIYSNGIQLWGFVAYGRDIRDSSSGKRRYRNSLGVWSR